MTLFIVLNWLPSLAHDLGAAAASQLHELAPWLLEHHGHLVDLFIVHAAFEALRSLFGWLRK